MGDTPVEHNGTQSEATAVPQKEADVGKTDITENTTADSTSEKAAPLDDSTNAEASTIPVDKAIPGSGTVAQDNAVTHDSGDATGTLPADPPISAEASQAKTKNEGSGDAQPQQPHTPGDGTQQSDKPGDGTQQSDKPGDGTQPPDTPDDASKDGTSERNVWSSASDGDSSQHAHIDVSGTAAQAEGDVTEVQPVAKESAEGEKKTSSEDQDANAAAATLAPAADAATAATAQPPGSDDSANSYFTGKYEHVRSENLEEILAVSGVSWLVRKLQKRSSPTVSIRQDGDRLDIKMTTFVFTKQTSFTMGQPFVDSLFGNTYTVTPQWENDQTFVWHLAPKDPAKGVQPQKHTRHLDGEHQLHLTLECGDVTCTRVFKKVVK